MPTYSVETTACPSCAQAMSRMELPQKNRGAVALDLCFSCQGIWFDQFESVRIAPEGIIELFKRIHNQRDILRTPLPDTLHCPRCNEALIHGLDLSQHGRFNYYRCLQNHGRFTVFSQFMIEKGFVRQLFPAEIKALATRIGSVHCTSCGAPVEIRTESACCHCKAPIAILDPVAVEKALANYQKKDAVRINRDPEALADALIAEERKRRKKDTAEVSLSIGDLFTSGIGIAWDLFDR